MRAAAPFFLCFHPLRLVLLSSQKAAIRFFFSLSLFFAVKTGLPPPAPSPLPPWADDQYLSVLIGIDNEHLRPRTWP